MEEETVFVFSIRCASSMKTEAKKSEEKEEKTFFLSVFLNNTAKNDPNLTRSPPSYLLFPSFSCSRAFLLASAIPSETASARDPSANPLALATSTAALAASCLSASSAAFRDASMALFALAIAGNSASSLSAATAPPKTPAAPTANTVQTRPLLDFVLAASILGKGLAASIASEAERVSISARAGGRVGAARGVTVRQRAMAAAVAAAEKGKGKGEVLFFPSSSSSPALAAPRPRPPRPRAHLCRGKSSSVSGCLPEVDAAAATVGARRAWVLGVVVVCAGGGEVGRERLRVWAEGKASRRRLRNAVFFPPFFASFFERF